MGGVSRTPSVVPILVAVLVSGCCGSRSKASDPVRSSDAVEPTATTRAAEGGISAPPAAINTEPRGAT